ncbi:MAG: DUF4349 domain-containing protein [Anaerolineales bacterium]|nr:DUF4349 domain-containing protein [Anaerolineales bacterium]MCX7609854.1 DUF4349 domain-containing protein [Anaerolineales bacterium]MDW8227313.1 DUF4349 domain-containing protein [Anaerolineales bacterium]
MKQKTLLSLVLLVLFLTACGTKIASLPTPEAVPDYGYGGEPGGLDQVARMPESSSILPESPAMPALEERMVMMNVNLTIVVSHPQTRLEEIGELARSLGGFVVSMNLYQVSTSDGGVAPEASISIRVPAEHLDAALEQIKTNAIEVRQENHTGQDVTAAYVDLQSRLKALEAARDQLEEIMRKAEKTEDVLNVFSQLQYYNEQIEVIKGQIKYYEESVAYSLINVTLIAEETIQPIKIGPWTPGKAARDAIQALIQFFQRFVDAVIYFFLLIVPASLLVFGPPALVIWVIVRALRRRKKKHTASAPSSE